MNQYIIPLPHNDPRLFSHVSQAFSLVDLGKRLLDAAKNGDVEEVKNLINNGAPFTTDWLGISPLHFAAMNGHLSSCEALLRAGISRDARTKVDRTPLHLAAQEGHADIVELLLKNGADLGAKDMLRMTALHWAAERGHTPVVQMLMRFGADAHLQNKFEQSPLDIAELKGHEDAREAMLNTQYDLLSSVGRMAATNGDLVHANAYILTDEETLVPAAPPADEVTVTATSVEESTVQETSTVSEIVNNNNNDSNNKIIPHTSDSSNDKISTCKRSWNNEETSKLSESDSDRNIRFSDESGNVPYTSSQSPNDRLVNSSNLTDKSTTERDLLLQSEEDEARDVMIVETPDGETLFVRQKCGSSGSNGLIILNSLGELVHNPNLMAQVINVMGNMSERESTGSPVHSNLTVNNEANLGFSQEHVAPNNLNHNSTKLSVLKQFDVLSKEGCNDLVTNASSSSYSNNSNGMSSANHRKIQSPHVIVNEDDEEDDLDNEDSDSLIAQLAAFANNSESRETICVEGMGTGTSTHDLIMWCLYNGIFIRGYGDEPTFVAEFVYQGEAYTLVASYDSQNGIINFYHVGTEPK